MKHRVPKSVALFLALSAIAVAQDLASFEKRITLKRLDNGLTVIICERPGAPVFSFNTHVDAGSVQDPMGQTGLAHMFEHMAFKGTDKIGTTDYAAEKVALAKVETAYAAYIAERDKRVGRDEQKLKDLQKAWQDAIADAQKYVKPNAFPQILESNGAEGLNASTSEDQTEYHYSFTENRLELWAYLESERFLHPVMREFYKERDVVREERRMRTESNPQGQLIEALSSTAFAAHPYKNGAAGWASDIENFRLKEAVQFYKTYYVPGNITIAIAGDVDPKEARRLADKYFARIPAGPLPPFVRTVEPPQTGEKRAAVESQAQPFIAIGYKRPDGNSKDDTPLDVLSEILAGGRTGLLYTELVRDKRMALAAFAQSSYPGDKYANLFLFFLVPNLGHTNEENEKAAYAIIERLKTKPVDPETLKRVRTKLRAELIHKLDSNSGLAAELTAYHVAYGDWKRLFTELDEVNRVSAEDVQRVAKEYLVPQSRTVAFTTAAAAPPQPAQTHATEAGHE